MNCWKIYFLNKNRFLYQSAFTTEIFVASARSAPSSLPATSDPNLEQSLSTSKKIWFFWGKNPKWDFVVLTSPWIDSSMAPDLPKPRSRSSFRQNLETESISRRALEFPTKQFGNAFFKSTSSAPSTPSPSWGWSPPARRIRRQTRQRRVSHIWHIYLFKKLR